MTKHYKFCPGTMSNVAENSQYTDIFKWQSDVQSVYVLGL